MKATTRIVILSNQTLLVDGVIARLQQYRDRVELYLVDLHHPNLLDRIMEILPAAIILDDKDPQVQQVAPLDELFRALPSIRVICLNTTCVQTQVIRSAQYDVAEVGSLLELIESTNPGALGESSPARQRGFGDEKSLSQRRVNEGSRF